MQLWWQLSWLVFGLTVAVAFVFRPQLGARRAGAALSALARSPPPAVFIALNLWENEPVLPLMREQLGVLIRALGPHRVYVSVFENGSRDGTAAQLGLLGAELDGLGVRNSIVSRNVPWRAFCGEAQLSSAAAALCRNESSVECAKLSRCPPSVRIPLMAAFRNMAMLPLYGVNSLSALSDMTAGEPGTPPTPQSLAHLGLPSRAGDDAVVLFLNDVLLRAEDAAALLATAGGPAAYDMACALDFEELKFYDTWVTRDLDGRRFSDWFPYARRPADVRAVLAGQPVHVYSCWNGAVAIRADALLLPAGQPPIAFRSSRPGEPRSVAARLAEGRRRRVQQPRGSPTAAPGVHQRGAGEAGGGDGGAAAVFDDSCAASECALIGADMWVAGKHRIFVNPAVRLFYNEKTERYQRQFMQPVVNPLLALAARARVFGEDAAGIVASFAPWSSPVPLPEAGDPQPPVHLECGVNPPTF